MEVSDSKVYVGNLPFSVGFEELKKLFSQFGEVSEATVIVNKYTGKSKGFGFVTFADKASAEQAIAEMNEKDVGGRRISVKQAMPPKERSEHGGRRYDDNSEDQDDGY